MHPCPFNSSHQSPVIVSDPSIKPLTPVGLDQTLVIVSLHQTTFPLMGLFSHTPYLFIVLLIFCSHISSDDHSLSFSTYSSSVHTPLFVCSHLWLIHGLCALPALNLVPIYSGRQSLSFCRFCQLRILLRFLSGRTLAVT